MKKQLNATVYDDRGYPLLFTQSDDPDRVVEDADELYPLWQTIIVTEPYRGMIPGTEGSTAVSERLVKIVINGKRPRPSGHED